MPDLPGRGLCTSRSLRFTSLPTARRRSSSPSWQVATPALSAAGVILPRKSVAPPAGAVGLCERYAWACASHIQGERALGADEILALGKRVNRSVNASVREVTDADQYGREEHWTLPTHHGGDCEDFALLKKRELLGMGVAPEHLLIATALTETREAHAVLILRTGAGDYVLDNRRNEMLPWRETGYSFLRMQDPDAPARWRMVLAGGMF